ncbi:hypothetical protein AVEN_179609-1 [Araneus ventricosus]|uniref:Uncharacterized protein n=1 Tax=Araneus ventricosus TaxID=182803 RepID=A0A4Y2BEV4_ARAVE|nr:hypothetical protein AVEN_179609-1 [Araneus ventricosus]
MLHHARDSTLSARTDSQTETKGGYHNLRGAMVGFTTECTCISDRFAVLEPSNLIETSETELPKFVHRNSTPKKISKSCQSSKRRVSWLDFLKILKGVYSGTPDWVGFRC